MIFSPTPGRTPAARVHPAFSPSPDKPKHQTSSRHHPTSAPPARVPSCEEEEASTETAPAPNNGFDPLVLGGACHPPRHPIVRVCLPTPAVSACQDAQPRIAQRGTSSSSSSSNNNNSNNNNNNTTNDQSTMGQSTVEADTGSMFDSVPDFTNFDGIDSAGDALADFGQDDNMGLGDLVDDSAFGDAFHEEMGGDGNNA